jgi:hypothetical protein
LTINTQQAAENFTNKGCRNAGLYTSAELLSRNLNKNYMNEKNRFVAGALFTNEKIERSLSQNRSGKAENLNVGSTGNIVVGGVGNVFGLGVQSELVPRKSRCKVF